MKDGDVASGGAAFGKVAPRVTGKLEIARTRAARGMLRVEHNNGAVRAFNNQDEPVVKEF